MSESKRLVEPGALQRILETARLATLVPALRPEVLHRVIQTCGLEDCGELLALATPDQIRRLSDLDLWRPARPGQTETFDADRFALWLEVLVDAGAAVAAQKLADMDRDVVATGLAEHIRVFERGTLSSFETTDGDLIPDHTPEDRFTTDLGGYVVIARRSDAWDAILSALVSLQSEEPACFAEIMTGVRAVSNSTPEPDGLDALLGAGDQLRHDARVEREGRREGLGYVSAGDARAFLEAARKDQVGSFRVPSVPTPPAVALSHPAAREMYDAAAPLVEVLQDAGLIDAPRTALLGAGPSARPLQRLRAEMEMLANASPGAYAARNADLAMLANTLVAGCSVQGRSFTIEEAWEAALATCNLGLERLEAPAGTLIHRDLRDIFQAGWTTLYDDVVMSAADALARALGDLGPLDPVIQNDAHALRHDLLAHLRTGTPWQARRRMDVLASLDTLAWVALLGLIDECPVRHAAIAAARSPTTHTVSATAFEFIGDTATVLEIRTFLQSLPAMLRA